MDYRLFGKTYYIRLDKGDEIVASILSVCGKEHIQSATFSGIGGCQEAEIQTYIPEKHAFETNHLQGMLELVSLQGNVVLNGENNELCHHTHALFCYKDEGGHHQTGGHIKSITVLYTAEIELRPVEGGVIMRKKDPETGTGFWDFR